MFHCSSIVLALGKKKFTWNCKNPCPIVLNCNYLPDPSSSCTLHSHIPNTPSCPPQPPGHLPPWSTTCEIKLDFHWLTPSSQHLPKHFDFDLSSRDERCWPSGSYSALTGKQWRRRRALSADAGSHPPCLVIPVRARTTYNVQSAQNPPCLVIPVRARTIYIVQRTKSTLPCLQCLQCLVRVLPAQCTTSSLLCAKCGKSILPRPCTAYTARANQSRCAWRAHCTLWNVLCCKVSIAHCRLATLHCCGDGV